MNRLARLLLPRTVRPRRIIDGPLRGAWLVTSWHDYPAGLTGRTERPLLDWFERHVHPGETWLDVGGHFGYTAIALAGHVGAAGRVFTFEPVRETADCIEQGRDLNHLGQIRVVNVALGAPPSLEIRQMPLTRGMADSTIAAAETVAITVARFDWLWPLLNDDNDVVHGVKIDVQGMELDVLHGMRQMLRRWHPRLVVELHAGVNRMQLLSLLADVGYSTEAVPIEPAPGERHASFLDDRSYAFVAA